MLSITIGILIRIFSNSYLNVFQKLLTQKGESSSVINFYTYLGLTIIGLLFCQKPIFSIDLLGIVMIMGLLGSLGNYFIIKALSNGELSGLAPINSYKPIIALILGIILLNEIPQTLDLLGIIFIILGTIILNNTQNIYNKATLYRFIALILSGTEAIFIKKLIIATNINSAFLYWAIAGLIFSSIYVLISKHPIALKKTNINFQILIIIMVALMQYSTNYVFSKMNVAYALALFQLSTIISVFLGINIFKEKGLVTKLLATFIMIFGAVLILIT